MPTIDPMALFSLTARFAPATPLAGTTPTRAKLHANRSLAIIEPVSRVPRTEIEIYRAETGAWKALIQR